MTFRDHIIKVTEKAGRTATALGRLMLNTAGPSSSKRKIMGSVVHSTLLYAAPAWHKALKAERNRRKMNGVQRYIALRVCSAYKTVSHDVALVISGIPPIKLMADERAEIYDGMDRIEARENLWRKWEAEWRSTDKGAWTKRLIPNIRQWAERRHGEVDYYLTQALTGHGCFGEYLHKIEKVGSSECMFCGENDGPEHTIFRCKRWDEERRRCEELLGNPLTPENMIEHMLNTEERWNIIKQTIGQIMRQKEVEEREIGPMP